MYFAVSMNLFKMLLFLSPDMDVHAIASDSQSGFWTSDISIILFCHAPFLRYSSNWSIKIQNILNHNAISGML